jgi:hypothetical protein
MQLLDYPSDPGIDTGLASSTVWAVLLQPVEKEVEGFGGFVRWAHRQSSRAEQSRKASTARCTSILTAPSL